MTNPHTSIDQVEELINELGAEMTTQDQAEFLDGLIQLSEAWKLHLRELDEGWELFVQYD